MRTHIAIIIIGLIFCSAAASAAEIRGTVVSTGQNPIEGAVVLHRPSGEKTETDAEGRFALTVPDSDRVRLEVIHPDHYEGEFLLTRRDLGGRVVLTLVPLIQKREEILVTASRYPESSLKVPAAAETSKKTQATGFAALSYDLGRGLIAFANVSKAYRVPSLSELFYTGISGRGRIIGNPELIPETSFNLDGGVKLMGRRFFAGFYGFHVKAGYRRSSFEFFATLANVFNAAYLSRPDPDAVEEPGAEPQTRSRLLLLNPQKASLKWTSLWLPSSWNRMAMTSNRQGTSPRRRSTR